jgi:hypothetical protein
MTAFDHFQEATCDIGSGNRPAAITHLDAAIALIDADGVDADLRPDLVALRETLAK